MSAINEADETDDADSQTPLAINLHKSAGPWCVYSNGQIIFDATEVNRGLGYNHSCLFGILQHAAAWTGDRNDPDLQGVISASTGLLKRAPEYCNWFQGENESSQSQNDQTDRLKPAGIRTLIGNYISASMAEQFKQTKAENLNRLLQFIQPQLESQTNLIVACQLVEPNHLAIQFRAPRAVLLARMTANSVRLDWSDDSSANAPIAKIHMPLGVTPEEIEWLGRAILQSANSAVKPNDQTSTENDVAETVENRSQDATAFSLLAHRDVERYFLFSAKLIECKLRSATMKVETNDLINFLISQLPSSSNHLQFRLLDSDNWTRWRSQVDALQHIVYEPARQTAIGKYDRLIENSRGLGLLACDGDQIAGMAFAGPLAMFPEERGTLTDPARHDPETLYMLDLTVAAEYRGRLGSLMKQGITLLAVTQGRTAIHGRNRDRLAAGMWAINLALGSFELQHLVDDYCDDQPYRDCIYYRCPLRWPNVTAERTSGEQNIVDFTDPSRMAEIINFRLIPPSSAPPSSAITSA